MRNKYRPLGPPPKPLRPGEIRFPDIDMKVMNGKEMPAVDEIAVSASEWASGAEETPGRAAELVAYLVHGFQMPEPSEASKALLTWVRNGWAVGQLEEERGVAKARKAERHYYAAVALRRGQLIDETGEGVASWSDALELGLYWAYFLRRLPGASVADLRQM